MVKCEYKKFTRTVTEDFLVSEKRYCDHCGKEITGRHYQTTTGHHDWGYDSIDSVKDKDYCCVDCLEQGLKQYYERSSGRYNSEYIKINHMNNADVEGETEYD